MDLPPELGTRQFGHNAIYLWRKPKPGQTLKGSYLGVLVLTDSHLIFLSSGGNDMLKRMAKAAIRPSAAHTDAAPGVAGLEQDGSFAIPLQDVQIEAVKRNLLYWFLRVTLPDGTVCSMQPKAGWGKKPTQLWAGIVRGEIPIPPE